MAYSRPILLPVSTEEEAFPKTIERYSKQIKEFDESEPQFSVKGDIHIRYATADVTKHLLVTGSREYQREKVTDLEFKQGMMNTVLKNSWMRIPQIHILVKYTKRGKFLRLEIMDGQQRFTSILDFVDNKFPLAPDFILKGKDYGGLYFSQLPDNLKNFILDYRVDAVYYGNLTNAEISELFVDILNNTNDMKDQEKRNALLGKFPTYVRDKAREFPHPHHSPDFHLLFRRVKRSDGKWGIENLPAFKLNGRMEVDQWVSQLAYLTYKGHDWTKGVSQKKHTAWAKSMTASGGEYSEEFTDKKFMDKILKKTSALVDAVPHNHKKRLTPMFTHMMVLYYMELTERFSSKFKCQESIFANQFMKQILDWSCKNQALYAQIDPETIEKDKDGKEILGSGKPKYSQSNGKVLGTALELFGGYNQNAITTIKMILDLQEPSFYGVTSKDERVSFSKKDIESKLREQNGLDFYTDMELDIKNAHGDHYIPRSRGGKTEYDNLVVCASDINIAKSNISPKDFIMYLKTEFGINPEKFKEYKSA